LKATFMIEEPDVERRRELLAALIGVEDRVWVRVNGYEPVYAIADEDLERSTADKTSSVHFLRFELADAMAVALKQGASLGIGIAHRHYSHEVEPVADAVRAALAADLD
ncbi:MAG: DUF3501 family protein, partial [Gammaproteobacteria bacterium]